MSNSKFYGWQPVAFGVLDGTAVPAAFVGETFGLGAVTDSGTGDWTVAVDADVGMPAVSTGGGCQVICAPFQRALAAGSVVVPLIVSAIALDLNSWDLATPSAADSIVGVLIARWPN